MTAIPKALAMANPKNVVACVATVAGVILSKSTIDTVRDELDNESDKDETDVMTLDEYKSKYGYRIEAATRCRNAYSDCEKSAEVCLEEYRACIQAVADM